MVHGDRDIVDGLCLDKKIKTISFVGSNQAGEDIYKKASLTGKRVQSNMGAKNHGVILPDADRDSVVNGLVGSAFGAGGQRCMALSVAIFVGQSQEWIEDVKKKA